MKNKSLTILLLTILYIGFSCENKSHNNSNRIIEKPQFDLLGESEKSIRKIDSLAIINIIESNDTLIIEVTMTPDLIPDSWENSKLLRDFILANVYTLNDEKIPHNLYIKISPNKKFTYTFIGRQNYNYLIFRDPKFIDYVEFIIKNLKANEMSYFNLIIPVLKDVYVDYDYNGTLMELLLDFYFFNERDEFIIYFFIFYHNCDFESESFSFDKSLLDNVLEKNNVNPDDWDLNKVRDLYLKVYSREKIITIEGDVIYPR